MIIDERERKVRDRDGRGQRGRERERETERDGGPDSRKKIRGKTWERKKKYTGGRERRGWRNRGEEIGGERLSRGYLFP